MAFDWEKYGITDARTGTSQADIRHNIDRLYQNVVGRNADPSGRDYWSGMISGGTNDYNTLLSGLTSSAEYKDRAAAVAAAEAAGSHITEAQLDMLPSAYVSPFHAGSGSAVAGWKPGDPLTEAIANAVTTATTNADGSTNAAANYGDVTNPTVGDVNAAYNVIDSTGGVGYIGGVAGTGADSDSDGVTNNYLTAADLDSWWDSLDKSSFTGSGSGSGGMDQFMQLMMFMAMMRPQGGGYGGGSYGYGGLNPGGVQSAYNPMANLQGYMDAFKTLPGISTSTINTGTTT